MQRLGKWSINSFSKYLLSVFIEQCSTSATLQVRVWQDTQLAHKGLKTKRNREERFQEIQAEGVSSDTKVQVANCDPLKKVSPWVFHISSLTSSWCVFLLRPQPSSKTPKVPKIYTKTGDKGRVGTGEKCKGRDGRFHLKVLPYSLQTLKSMWQISVGITQVWCKTKDAPDKLNDKSKLQNNPELGCIG